MMKNNAYNRFMTGVFDLAEVSVLTLICCIPVLTAGAAITAACAMFMKMAENREGTICKEYFRQFRGNLRESLGGWILNLAVVCIILTDLYLTRENALQYGLILSLAGAAGAYLCWYFCLRARFSESTFSAVVNTLKFTAAFFPVSLVCGAYFLLAAAVMLRYTAARVLFPVLGIAALFYIPFLLLGRKINAYVEDKGLMRKNG